MQLIKITTVPMQYTMEVEAPRLEVTQAPNPQAQMTQKQGQMKMKSENIKVRLDTTDARRSMGIKNNTDFAASSAAAGKQAASSATAKYAQMAARMTQSPKADITQFAKENMVKSQQLQTTFLPSVGPNISWEPPNLSMQYEPATINTDWQIQKNQMNYVPGKFKMNITQYPRVKIEYIGEPNYVPPSANPNYEGKP